MKRQHESGGIAIEELLRALSEWVRLRLLNLIRDQELCVCYFVQVLDLPQPTVSRHLAHLRKAGLVAARREGYWMHYRFAIPAHACAAKLLADVLAWAAEDPQMIRDRERLARARCSPQDFVSIQNAPTPRLVSAEQL